MELSLCVSWKAHIFLNILISNNHFGKIRIYVYVLLNPRLFLQCLLSSVNSPGTSANHLSYSKSNEPSYPVSTGMNPVGMNTNTAAHTAPSSISQQQSLDPSQQRGPPHYGQSAQQKQVWSYVFLCQFVEIPL